MARVLTAGRGVTLAETILALGLCVVVVLVAVALAICALRAHQKGSDQAVASAYATQVIENFVYNLPPSTDAWWSTTSYGSPYQTDQVRLGSVDFRADLHLRDLGTMAGGVKVVTVNVTWAGSEAKANYGSQVTQIAQMIYAR